MLSALRASFDDNKIDAVLVSNMTNIFYLSGFRGTNGFAVVTKNHQYLMTDSRYIEKAQKVVSDDWRVLDLAEGLTNVLCTTLLKHKVRRLGVEADSMTVSLYEKLEDAGCMLKIISTSGLVERLRQIKTTQELRAIRESQKLNEQTLKLLLNEVRLGVSEADLAWKLRCIARDLGADDLSFPPIIAFGAHSSMPHHETSHQKKLRRGDMILIDMGVMVKQFASDMTRTFFTKTPTKEQAHVYETVLEAQRRAIDRINPGVPADEVDKAARQYICDAGYHKKFGHATGHGIGMDVHEIPAVAKAAKNQLEEGMVVTVEPGIYLPGRLGVRIEDMIEVRANGYQNLTHFVKDVKSVLIM